MQSRPITTLEAKKGKPEKHDINDYVLEFEAEGLKPLGWVSLGPVTDEMFQGLERIEKAYKEKSNRAISKETERPNISDMAFIVTPLEGKLPR